MPPQKFWERFETKLQIKKPVFPPGDGFPGIAQYLIDYHKANIRYYKIVIGIGIVGIGLTAIFIIYLLAEHGFDKIFKIKVWPSAIASLITTTFGLIELEMEKKALYQLMHNLSVKKRDWEDEEKLADNYKAWLWSEYQDKFKG